MTVTDILKAWLEANGYDGLCNPETECGCYIADLAPCCEAIDWCQPGHRAQNDTGEWGIYAKEGR